MFQNCDERAMEAYGSDKKALKKLLCLIVVFFFFKGGRTLQEDGNKCLSVKNSNIALSI
jgi:hypothetical protein